MLWVLNMRWYSMSRRRVNQLMPDLHLINGYQSSSMSGLMVLPVFQVWVLEGCKGFNLALWLYLNAVFTEAGMVWCMYFQVYWSQYFVLEAPLWLQCVPATYTAPSPWLQCQSVFNLYQVHLCIICTKSYVIAWLQCDNWVNPVPSVVSVDFLLAECSPTSVDFTKGDLVESGKALAPAIKGFAFRNFSGSNAKRSAIASLSKADTADQVC